MKNLKINRKLFIAFAVIIVLLVACIIIGIASIQKVETEVDTFYNGPFIVKGSANTIKANFELIQKSVYRSMATEDLALIEDALNDVESAVATIQEQLPIVQEHFLGDQQIVANLQNDLNKLAPHREKALQLASTNRNTEAAIYMEENNIPIIDSANAELNKLISTANDNGEELIADLNRQQEQSVIVLLLVGIISVVLGIIFGLYITRGIVRPVREIENAAKEMAKGNLNYQITYQSKDEMGQLAENLRIMMVGLSAIIEDVGFQLGEMADKNFVLESKAAERYVGDYMPILEAIRHINFSLSDTIRQIGQAAEQVAGGSEQVSSGSQALSQGATEQASSVEELAATISEISQHVKKNAENAMEARTGSDMVRDEMTQSNHQMQEMIQAMAEISNSSGEIGKIIKTIEDIAFQTNILALNAAVEAARAGAAGKGFAVVADEVRNLASKSAEASQNTSTLIENSIKAVENGTRIADATAKSMMVAVEGTEKVTNIVNDISEASTQQANSIGQVTIGVDQISSVVQTNSATAEESAAASEELSGQAQILKNLVSQFRIADGEYRNE